MHLEAEQVCWGTRQIFWGGLRELEGDGSWDLETYRRMSVSKYARSMVTNWVSIEADMAGHEKNLRDEPEGENWTNGAREESRSASQDEIPTRKCPGV